MEKIKYNHQGKEYDLTSALIAIIRGYWDIGVDEVMKILDTDVQHAITVATSLKKYWLANKEKFVVDNENESPQTQLADKGYSGYYEYKVISILDEKGHTNTNRIEKLMNQLGLEGWKLRTATTNEIGKNAVALGFEGLGFGVNSTVDETILYFERYVPLQR